MIIEVELTQGYKTIIDAEDYEVVKRCSWYVWTNSVRSKAYAMGWIKGKNVLLHRLIMNAEKGQFVDHISHNTLDNRRRNLRICTRAENNRNRIIAIDNTSGYKGVGWYKSTSKWVARITINYKLTHLGYFHDKDDAARAYNKAAIKYHGEFALLNEITPGE